MLLKRWQILHYGDTANTARLQHFNSLLSSTLLFGCIFVGGYADPTVSSSCEMYCPIANTWTELADMHHQNKVCSGPANNQNVEGMASFLRPTQKWTKYFLTNFLSKSKKNFMQLTYIYNILNILVNLNYNKLEKFLFFSYVIVSAYKHTY